MAKIVLRDGTNGARTKMISALKSELTHAFLHDSSPLSLDFLMTNDQFTLRASDEVKRVVELQFTSDTLSYKTTSNVSQPDNSKITNFFLKSGRTVNKIVLLKPDGINYLVNGIITIPTITPTHDTSYFIRELKIDVLDQV